MAEEERSDWVEFSAFRLYPRLRKLYCGPEEVQLGGRAMDLLICLASKPGALATRDELVAAAWPSLFVHESNLKVTIASLRRALRECCPSDDSINTVIGRGYWLRTEVLPQTAEVTEPSSAASAPLPELGTIIGRDATIAELRETLERHRLTTIVGAGGMGKTTVAVAAAQLFADAGLGAVAFVDLARVASAEFVTSSLAAALGVSSAGGDRLLGVVSILTRRKMLLLLDTCEHVLAEVARICDVLLAGTRDVRILATSRQVLGVPGEELLWLAPLEVPPSDVGGAEDVLRYSAAQLLVARANEKSGYVLNDEDARPIGEICRRLDGAPLALELISSRLVARNTGAILQKLDDRFRNLRRLSPGGPLRQQTLLATLEWSYSLLEAHEASVLRAISIFAGQFAAEDAERVLAHLRPGPNHTQETLARLCDKSMLSVDGAAGPVRYRLLDSTRAFASDLLDAHGEVMPVSANHARLQLETLTCADAALTARSARERLVDHTGRADDLRKALEWALHRSNEPLLGIELAAAGLPLWHELSLGEECRRHCQTALAELDRLGCNDSALKLRLVVGLASTNTFLSADPEATMALFETAIRLARETGDAVAECRALGALAMYEILPGREGAVTELLDQMSEAAARSNDRRAVWEHEQLRAEWELNCCEFPASLRRLERLRAELRDEVAGSAPRFQIDQRTNIETTYGAPLLVHGQARAGATPDRAGGAAGARDAPRLDAHSLFLARHHLHDERVPFLCAGEVVCEDLEECHRSSRHGGLDSHRRLLDGMYRRAIRRK